MCHYRHVWLCSVGSPTVGSGRYATNSTLKLLHDFCLCGLIQLWNKCVFVIHPAWYSVPRFRASLGGSVGCASDWRPGGRGFDPRRGRQHSFMEIDHEIFSTVILSLPLIQEGQLSVSGERMCTILVNRLEDKACPVNVWLGKLTVLDMTPLGWLGRKTSTQTSKPRFSLC